MYEIGQLIKYHRKKMNLTLKQLGGKMVGYSAAAISKIEAGKYNPPKHMLEAIQKALHIKELVYDKQHPVYVKLSAWQKEIAQNNIAESTEYYLQMQQYPVSFYTNYESVYLLQRFQHSLLCFHIEEAASLVCHIQETALRVPQQDAYHYNKSLAFFYVLQDQLKNAHIYLRVAKRSDKNIFEEDGAAHLYQAILYSKMENYIDSNHHASIAIKFFLESMNNENLLLSRIILIINDIPLGKTASAIPALHKLLENNRNSIHTTFIQYILSLAYLFENNYDASLKHSREAINKEDRKSLRVAYLYLRAFTYVLIGNKDNANVYISGGLKLKQGKKYDYKFYILHHIVQQSYGEESFKQKMKKEIIRYYQQTGDKAELDFCYVLLGKIHYDQQHYKQSADYFFQATSKHNIAKLLTMYPQK